MKNFVALKKLFHGFANAFVSAMCVFAVPVLPSHAQEKRVYQTDQGRIQYHKPGYAILSDGRIIETDSTGTKQYHKPQYKIKDGTVYATDSGGSIQYHKPSLSIQSDGKVFQKDRSGNILYGKEHYIQKNDNIYQTDQFGRIQYHKPGFKVVTQK